MPAPNPISFGTDPGLIDQQVQLARAQQLAQMLQSQAQEPIQSSRPDVPVSWAQGAAKLLAGYGAKKQTEKSDALQKQVASAQAAQFAKLLGMGQPQPTPPISPIAATPQGQDLPPGGGVMANSATPQAAQLGSALGPQQPPQRSPMSVTGNPGADLYLMQNDPQGYLGQVMKSHEPTQQQLNDQAAGITPAERHSIDTRELTAGSHVTRDLGGSTQEGTYHPQTGQTDWQPPVKKTLTAEQQREVFDSRHASLLAAMAARGVTLPSGLRSKEQMRSTLDGLVQKYPDLNDDQIADNIANGKINFGAQNKAAQVAGAQAGKVALGLNEIKEFAPIVLDASKKVDRGSFVPITKLMQMGDQQISDPNLRNLKIAVTSMLNAYDQVAARGGTDVGKREAAHSLLTSADSPEVLASAVAMFQREAEAAERAAQTATHTGGQAPAAPPAPDAGITHRYNPATGQVEPVNGAR